MEREEDGQLLCEVLGSVASQMRASLGNIHAALRQLAADQALQDGGDAKYAAILTQSYYRILRVVDNMSDMSRLAEEKIVCGPERDIVSLLEDLVCQAQPLADKQNVTLTFRSAEKRHLVSVHKGYMERLVWNLLSNALKFTPAGGRIDVSLDFRGGQVLLTVADNGCGIAPDMLEQVFERYLHPDRMDPQPHGLGLGLPLCRRIAEGHGGRLLLTSREGEGTTATVALPDQVSQDLTVETPIFVPDGGFSCVLVGLSDALGFRAFTHVKLDE
ncbi:MAG: HAMP domain-containing histidine kinase [Oscillospiraceae bacterium]|nr:HAMP domain-containing histidine kinase [Oscillospiraceae bacterium]